MPKLSLPILESENGFVRPVVLDVTRKLMEVFGIDKSTPIYYPSDLERVAKPGSTITEDPLPNVTPSGMRLSIEVTETPLQDSFGTMAVNYPDAPLIFLDDALGVAMKPVYATREYSIQFKYRAIDKTAAERWQNGVETKLAQMVEQIDHTVSFSYLIPMEFMVVLMEIHRLREAQEGYGETFAQWLAKYGTKRISDLVTQAGTEPRPAVAETVPRIVGWFEFAGAPEKSEKEGQGPTFTASFEYKFHMQKPIDVHISYPVVVHGQVVKYIGYKQKVLKDRIVGASLSMAYQYAFEAQVETDQFEQYLGFQVPEWDEFVPNTVTPNTLRVLQLLTAPDAQKFLMNLGTDITPLEFHPAVLRFLKSEAAYVTKAGRSVFKLSVYRNQDMIDANNITIDNELNVHFKEVQSVRPIYHLRLDLYVNWSKIDPAAIDRLRKDGEAAVEIIKTINPHITVPQFIEDTTVIPRQDMADVIDEIIKGIRGGFGPRYQFNTVGTLFITAHDKERYATHQHTA